jgi:hypothetical protein
MQLEELTPPNREGTAQQSGGRDDADPMEQDLVAFRSRV